VRQGVESAKGLVNDGIDIENILVALYGKDFLSADVKAVELLWEKSKELDILKGYPPIKEAVWDKALRDATDKP